jgi:hypothetical protein
VPKRRFFVVLPGAWHEYDFKNCLGGIHLDFLRSLEFRIGLILFFALAFAIAGNKFYPPVEASLADVMKDAKDSAIADFSAIFEDTEETSYQPKYEVGNHFFIPSLFQTLSIILAGFGAFYIYKNKVKGATRDFHYIISILMMVLSVAIVSIIGYKGITNIILTLAHSVTFLIVTILLSFFALAVIGHLFKAAHER